MKLSQLANLLRVRQWHKNSFVFLGFFVLGDYYNYTLLIKSALSFAAFCLASSAIYILNDFHDMDYDRSHPVKRSRPLASKAIQVKPALTIALILCVASISISLSVSLGAISILFIYLVNNIAYTYLFKKYPIIDVFQIGIGFMLRIFMGTVGIGIHISEWMVITGFMISLLIGFSKRFAELSNSKMPGNQRKVLQEYSLEILRSFMIIMASATIITYSLYTLSARSIEIHGTTNLIYTIPFVVYGIFRFLYLVLFNQSGEDPSSQILEDRQLVSTVILWVIIYGIIIY